MQVQGNKGLAPTVPGMGSLIVYATAPDAVAYDGRQDHSPFSSAFADQALTPGIEVRDLVTRIRNEVIKSTQGRQVPWDSSSLTTSFYFIKPQNLVASAAVTDVTVPAVAKAVPLHLGVPLADGTEPLTVEVTRTPAHGVLELAGKPVEAAASIRADDLAEIAYKPAPGQPGTDQFGYRVKTADGRALPSTVRIRVDAKTVASADSGRPAAPAARSDEPATAEKPRLIAMAADVGTGFVPVGGELGATKEATDGWLRLGGHDPGAQVSIDRKVLAPGDLVRVADLRRLSIRPSLADAGRKMDVAFVPASARETGMKPLSIEVAASVNECDRLAAEPLDIQGVTKGVLPNEIDIPAAKAACAKAVSDYPAVGRFKFEYARALYADGDFQAAVDNLRLAYKQGHVRAGEWLGRMYQLGVTVRRDPAEAIPYFEAAEKKGDPYAQYVFGKALIYGKGIRPNVPRGIDLLTSAAQSGHTYAMNQLGAEYRYGQHVRKDVERALAFFRKSTERGDVWGMVNLGLLYRDGVGVPKDPDKAMSLFVKADEGGQPAAGTLISMMKRSSGNASPSDIIAGFRRSAGRGDAWGAFYAAEMIAADASLSSDPYEAARLFALSASQQTDPVSGQARASLAKLPAATVDRAVQSTLADMGQDVGAIDGVLGKRTREAAAAVLGKAAPGDARVLLIELVRARWIRSQPRLDML